MKWFSIRTRPGLADRLAVAGLLLSLAACVQIPERPGLSMSALGRVDASCHVSTSVAERPGLSPGQIAVLNWNVYKGSGDGWLQDLQRLSAGRDLVLLQEARLDTGLRGQLAVDDYHWGMTNAFILDATANGVLNASREPAIEHCAQYVSEPLIRIPKSLLVSRYALEGRQQTLLVANVHGINFTTGMGSYRRQLDALAGSLAAHEGPIILAGDFNSWSQARLDALNAVAGHLGLQRVAYSGHNRKRIFQHSVDHIYYRDLRIVKAHSPSVASSDHNPLLVTFALDMET